MKTKLLFILFLLITSPLFAASIQIQDEGSSQGFASRLDCVGAGISCSRSGITGTLTVTGVSGGNATVAIEEDNVEVLSTSSPRFDFGSGFDVSESPADEANITLDLSEVALTTFSEINSSTSSAGNVLVANGNNFDSVAMSGDATISSAGALTVIDDSHAHIFSDIDATTSANWAGRVSDETGSGAWVFATSPTLVTPALGTPSSGVGTNLTALNATQLTTGTVPAARVGASHIDTITEIAAGLKDATGACSSGLLCLGGHTHAISTEVSGLGSNVATFLATPSTANFASAVTGETGTGAVVFGTAPTFTTSIAFNAVTDTVAGIQNQNLVDKTATEVVTGDWDFGGGGIEIENNTAVPGSCTVGQIFMDTDATSGQQIYGCEGGTFVLQGDGGGVSSLSSLSDVNSATPTAGRLLIANGTDFDSSSEFKGTYTAESTVVFDLGAATSFEVPNGTGPTTPNVAGEIVLDTDDLTGQGTLLLYDGAQVIKIFGSQDNPSDNEVLKYDAGGGTVQWEADSTAGGSLTSLSDVNSATAGRASLLVADGSEWHSVTVGSDDQVLTADSTAAFGLKWATGGGGASNLTDLGDVNSATATRGRILIADGSNWHSMNMIDHQQLFPYSGKLAGDFITMSSSGLDVATQGATIEGGDGPWKVLFDAGSTEDEAMVWQWQLPDSWVRHDKIEFLYSMASATTNEVEWECAIKCVSDGDQIDSNVGFVAATNVVETVPGTAGLTDTISFTLSDALGTCVSGDMMYVYISTDSDDTTNDDATGDREMSSPLYYFERGGL